MELEFSVVFLFCFRGIGGWEIGIGMHSKKSGGGGGGGGRDGEGGGAAGAAGEGMAMPVRTSDRLRRRPKMYGRAYLYYTGNIRKQKTKSKTRTAASQIAKMLCVRTPNKDVSAFLPSISSFLIIDFSKPFVFVVFNLAQLAPLPSVSNEDI